MYSVIPSEIISDPRILTAVYAIVILSVILSKLPERSPRAALVLALLLMAYTWVSLGMAIYMHMQNQLSGARMLMFIPAIALVYGLVYACLPFADASAFEGPGFRDRTSAAQTWGDATFLSIMNMSPATHGGLRPVSRLAQFLTVTQFVAWFALITALGIQLNSAT